MKSTESEDKSDNINTIGALSDPYEFDWADFFDVFDDPKNGNRNSILREVDHQQKLELSTHGSEMQKLGIILGFSSLCLVELLLSYGSLGFVSRLAVLLYGCGATCFALCSIIGILQLLSEKSYADTGMHIWDIEDKVMSHDTGDICLEIQHDRIVSTDELYISNRNITFVTRIAGIFLFVGIVLLITAFVLGYS